MARLDAVHNLVNPLPTVVGAAAPDVPAGILQLSVFIAVINPSKVGNRIAPASFAVSGIRKTTVPNPVKPNTAIAAKRVVNFESEYFHDVAIVHLTPSKARRPW